MKKIKDCEIEKPNGCGPEGLPDFILDVSDLMTTEATQRCCEEHDMCYSACGSEFTKCEKEFRPVLKNEIFYHSKKYILSGRLNTPFLCPFLTKKRIHLIYKFQVLRKTERFKIQSFEIETIL